MFLMVWLPWCPGGRNQLMCMEGHAFDPQVVLFLQRQDEFELVLILACITHRQSSLTSCIMTANQVS